MNFRLILLLVSLTLVAPCWSQINSSGSISQPTVNQSTFNKEARQSKRERDESRSKKQREKPRYQAKSVAEEGKSNSSRAIPFRGKHAGL